MAKIWYENESYEINLTIADEDPSTCTYEVTCDRDDLVTITQDAIEPNIFHIDVSSLTDNRVLIIMEYKITDNVSNENITHEYFVLSKRPVNDKRYYTKTEIDAMLLLSPNIDNIQWSSSIQHDNETYDLTINASDPQDQILTYEVTCDEPGIDIVQDVVDETLFHVTYPNYVNDMIILFIIKVTNQSDVSDSVIFSKYIINHLVNPVIDSFVWNDNNHEENETYDLTINASDENDQDLTYEVECDDSNVDIVQDGTDETIFHVTYPNYSTDTTVTYTITVTNEDSLTDIETDIKIVSNILTRERGIFGGGNDGTCSNVLDHITISSIPSNAIDFGDLTVARYDLAACSNGINERGVFGGGYDGTAVSDTIDYITISSPGNATDFEDLSIARNNLSACSNGINERGVFGGGYDGTIELNMIDYITISIPGIAVDFGDLSVAKDQLAACSNGTNNRGIFTGGYDGTIELNTIDYITISTPGNAIDFGDLTVTRDRLASCSNGTNDRGIFAGGYDGSIYLNEINYITISSAPNDAVDFGDLTVARSNLASTSNGINDRGVFAGGSNGSNLNEIDYITISSAPDNAADFGDLSITRSNLAACSDG